MKRSRIFLLNRLSERELDLLKKDLFDHIIVIIKKIKNLNLNQELIEEITNNIINKILINFKFEEGKSLGDAIKTAVFADLKAEYAKRYPDKVNRVVWPDLSPNSSFDEARKSVKKHRLDEIEKFKKLPKDKLNKLVVSSSVNLKNRQQVLLKTIFTSIDSLNHLELSKILGVNRSTVTNDIRIIYMSIMNTIKKLQ